MDVARCTSDNITYTTTNFANLLENEIISKRKFLICPECEGTAYFKKASTSGLQAACFGSLYHQENCSLASSLKYENSEAQVETKKYPIANMGSRIVLDLSYDMPMASLKAVYKEPADARKSSDLSSDSASSEAVISRQPSSVLKLLCTSEQFRNSQRTIDIPSKGRFTAADFFVNFTELTSSHDGQYGGYWGEISNVRSTKGPTLWLDPIGPEPYYVTILIPPALVASFSDRFPKKDKSVWVSFALVLGTMEVGHGGKRYIRVDNPALIAVQ